MSRWVKANAGYIPLVAVGVGAGIGGWVASGLGLGDWVLAVPGMVGGYFASRAILRRMYAPEE